MAQLSPTIGVPVRSLGPHLIHYLKVRVDARLWGALAEPRLKVETVAGRAWLQLVRGIKLN